ncbi:MAG: protein tyrosine kinase modulator [Blastocatellia bacterium]
MPSFRPRTFTEYLQLIWHRKLLFFLVFMSMLLATFVIVRRIPDQYQSKASIVIAGSQDDRAATAARVTTTTERVYSRAFLEPLILRHNIYSKEVERGAMEAAVSRMRKDIKVDTKYRGDYPESLTIAYRNPNPEAAQAVASDIVAAFGTMNQAIAGRFDEQASEISRELGELESRLSQLGQQRAIASARNRSASQSRGSFDMHRAQRQAAESSVEALTDKQYALQQQITETKRQIAEQEKLAKAAPRDVKSGSSYGVLLVRKAELEAQLKDYQSQYTDKNPKVVQVQTQIAELNRQIAALKASDSGDVVPDSAEARELRALQRELANKQTELAVVERELGRKQQTLSSTPSVSASAPVAASAPITDIASETSTDRLGDRYTYLLRRQDELRQTRGATAGLDPGIFQIVDRPTVPQTPAGPDRMRLQLIGLAIALALGLLAAIVSQAPRLFEVRDDRDVNYYLGAPVIALIPESFTPVERGRQRTMTLARRGLLLLLGIVLVPGLILLLNQIGLFQLLAGRW